VVGTGTMLMWYAYIYSMLYNVSSILYVREREERGGLEKEKKLKIKIISFQFLGTYNLPGDRKGTTPQ
jgi:hypothetical protein